MWSIAIEELLKYANCTEETMQAKTLQDGKKKLRMDFATLNTGLNGEGVCEEENGLLVGYDDGIMMK